MPDDAVHKNEKTARKSPNILAYQDPLSATTWRRERDTEAQATTGTNLAGTMRAQGKSWAEIAAAVGAADGLPVRW
jgi:hypothetical protein